MNITREVEKYVTRHASMRESLKSGIVNYSKLSRKIIEDLGFSKNTFDSVLAACRRYADKLEDSGNDKKVIKILKNSELEIKTKVIVAIVSKVSYKRKISDLEKELRPKSSIFYSIEGTKVFTLILSKNCEEILKEILSTSIIKLTSNLALITITSSEDMESVSGVISAIYSLLGENDINIIETMSCWTDTILVVDEKNIQKVMKVIEF